MMIQGILEACLYAADLDAAEQFYTSVLDLQVFSRVAGRHVFFRCGDGMFLVFNPDHTASEQSTVSGIPVPLHGSHGVGHVAFAVPHAELPLWRERWEGMGVVIEAEIAWPRGGRSLYLRDPAGNSVELATPQIWGLSDASQVGGFTSEELSETP